MLGVCLLHQAKLVVARLDCLTGLLITLPERLVLVVFDADRTGLDVLVGRALRWFIGRVQLTGYIIVFHALVLVHGLVSGIKVIVIAKGRVHFLLDHSTHNRLELIGHGIQKLMLIFNLLL